MEKRKVFKISIIDKEISRTEFDRNTFYTSDSELTLVFKLIEKNYKYDNGEILLFNEDDKSFITRPITKIDNDFVYELDLDIIPHYGKWQAQLQLVKDGDVYTSKPFDFSIVNDLSNLAPQPTLTDINNWSTLKNSANELIDEMQDIIDDVEKAELERDSYEIIRKKSELTRAKQESVRQQDEFKRNSQESVRQQSELTRAKQESVRQQDEFKRNSQESVRQQSESERVDKENIRQQNESNRASAEAQRKIDHANRSAELAGKADKVVIKNLVENGDFTTNETPWTSGLSYIRGSLVILDDYAGRSRVAKVTKSIYGRTWIFFGVTNAIESHKYFLQAKVYTDTPNSFYIRSSLYATGNAISGHTTKLVAGEWITHRYVLTATQTGYVVFGGEPQENSPLYFDELMLLDLTETFGVGNEPTQEEMDELIKVTGYIDGEYALNNKELLIWTLSLLRSNRNAIISLGGTI